MGFIYSNARIVFDCKGWERRRDVRAQEYRKYNKAMHGQRASADSKKKKKSDAELMKMVSMNLVGQGQAFGAGDLGPNHVEDEEDDDEDEEEGGSDGETEEEWLARDLTERQQATAQSQRRAVSREAEVGACEHNLALLQSKSTQRREREDRHKHSAPHAQSHAPPLRSAICSSHSRKMGTFLTLLIVAADVMCDAL